MGNTSSDDDFHEDYVKAYTDKGDAVQQFARTQISLEKTCPGFVSPLFSRLKACNIKSFC